jgi:hypothetical protein
MNDVDIFKNNPIRTCEKDGCAKLIMFGPEPFCFEHSVLMPFIDVDYEVVDQPNPKEN